MLLTAAPLLVLVGTADVGGAYRRGDHDEVLRLAGQGQQIDAEKMGRVREVLESRVNSFGLSGTDVRQKTTVLVAFAADLPVIDQIVLADGNPLRPTPPPAPAMVPGAAPTRTPGGPTTLQPGATRPPTAPATGPLSDAPGGPGKPTKG